jgi:hypothetical protein
VSPYLQTCKYDSYGAQEILSLLLSGQLFDYGRPPVLTVLLALGLAAACVRRTATAKAALVLFALWLMLYFGRVTWGRLTDLLPMHEGLLFHRFIGALEFASILLVGVGGEWFWERFSALRQPWRVLVPGTIVLMLIIPALQDRYLYYKSNTQWLKFTRTQLNADADLRTIIDTLKTLPPGRVYAGRRTDWGQSLKKGALHLYDVLTFEDLDVLEPPYQGLSHNAELVFHFDNRNPALYDLFDVKYVVAQSTVHLPAFLSPAKITQNYILYRVDTSGFGELAKTTVSAVADSRRKLFERNLEWMSSADGLASGRFIRWSYALGGGRMSGMFYPDSTGAGNVSDEEILPDVIRLHANVPERSTLIIKTTYHPKWHVMIDGAQAESFMASPSFIGVRVPAGEHEVSAEYSAGALKNALLVLGFAALIVAIGLRNRFERIEQIFRR